MQHVDHASQLDCVNRSKGVAVEVRYNLKNARTSETGKGLGVWMFVALLRRPEGESDAAFNVQWILG